MNEVFEVIRNQIPMQDIAKFYGLQISRSGMACCPFHEALRKVLNAVEN